MPVEKVQVEKKGKDFRVLVFHKDVQGKRTVTDRLASKAEVNAATLDLMNSANSAET